MECHTYLRNVTDLLSMGRRPMKDVLGNHRPIIPFGSLVEYNLITAKDQSRIHHFGKKSLTWIVPWIRFVRGENVEGFGCRH